jgi:hypothetical protein
MGQCAILSTPPLQELITLFALLRLHNELQLGKPLRKCPLDRPFCDIFTPSMGLPLLRLVFPICYFYYCFVTISPRLLYKPIRRGVRRSCLLPFSHLRSTFTKSKTLCFFSSLTRATLALASFAWEVCSVSGFLASAWDFFLPGLARQPTPSEHLLILVRWLLLTIPSFHFSARIVKVPTNLSQYAPPSSTLVILRTNYH